MTLAYRGSLTPRRAGGTAASRQAGWRANHRREHSDRVSRRTQVGYVLGTKAGRQRYEQIVGTYRAVTGHPATKSMIDAGRRKIADRVSRTRRWSH